MVHPELKLGKFTFFAITIIYEIHRPDVKPRPFKILDHETDDMLIYRLQSLADQQWKDQNLTVSKDLKAYKERPIWLYNRAKLEAAATTAVFDNFDGIIPANVPMDSGLIRDWLNLQHSRSLIPANGARVDLTVPLEFDICLIPDEAL